MIIGLTGLTGSGKSTAAEWFRKNGFTVVDCDRIGHEILRPGGSAEASCIKAFGDIILDNGVISRKKLGALVFSDEEKRKTLNRITHPIISEEVKRWLSLAENGNAVIDAALLFESGMDALCDKTIAVTAEKDVRLSRITARDSITKEAALLRINAQDDALILERADAMIDNSGEKVALFNQIQTILQSW